MAEAWKCDVCGYVHKGDAAPDLCPVCGVKAVEFSVFDVGAPLAVKSTASWRCRICGFEHAGDAPPLKCPLCSAGPEYFVAKDEVTQTVSDKAVKIVIIGGGIAAVTAAQSARETSAEAEITVISKEGAPYYRLNLTRYLSGEVSRDGLTMCDDAWFSQQRVIRVDDEAKEIRRQDKAVVTTLGKTIPYDKLILANGAHPFVPAIAGAARAGVSPLRTVAHADLALAAAANGGRVVIVGGGLLGLETAGALNKKGSKVTVLEGFTRLLPRQLPKRGGELLEASLRASGIEVKTSAKTKEIVGDEKVRGVLLESGEEIDADFVVISCGIRPNSHLARKADIKVNIGVLADDTMTTSDPDILAAGDTAEHRGICYGIWPAAYAQALVAGCAAAGGAREFRGMPMSHRIKVLDVNLFSIGVIEPTDGGFEVFETERNGSYRRIVVRDGRIVGAALFGDASLSNAIQAAVESSAQIEGRPDLQRLLST
jgi:nitrite reductase (NADH) large subunit